MKMVDGGFSFHRNQEQQQQQQQQQQERRQQQQQAVAAKKSKQTANPVYVVICTILSVIILFDTISFSKALSSSFLTRRDWITSSVSSGTVPALLMSSSSSTSTNAKNMANKNEQNDTIRWGIVGLGDVCQVKSGPAFWKCQNSELVAVMRRTPGKASEFAKRVPGGNCIGYDNIQSFLEHDSLDAVYVATRPGSHLELCKQIADAGLACYVEKPVGRCADETKRISQLFRRQENEEDDNDIINNKKINQNLPPLYTAYISRAYDRTTTIRHLLFDEQVIGSSLQEVTYTLVGTGGARDMDVKDNLPWRLQAEQSGGGLIMDVGCHIIDRLEYLCGGILTNVKGNAQNRNSPNQDVEDYVVLDATIGKKIKSSISSSSFETKGASVKCTWDFAGDTPKDELTFKGPKGSLTMVGMSPAGPVQLLDCNGNLLQEWAFDVPEHTAQKMIQAVTNDLLRQRQQEGRTGTTTTETLSLTNSVLSYGDNAIRTQQVLDVCLDSYYGGREIGYWTRSNSWPGRPS